MPTDEEILMILGGQGPVEPYDPYGLGLGVEHRAEDRADQVDGADPLGVVGVQWAGSLDTIRAWQEWLRPKGAKRDAPPTLAAKVSLPVFVELEPDIIDELAATPEITRLFPGEAGPGTGEALEFLPEGLFAAEAGEVNASPRVIAVTSKGGKIESYRAYQGAIGPRR